MKRVLFDTDIFANGSYEDAKEEHTDDHLSDQQLFERAYSITDAWFEAFLWEFQHCISNNDCFVSRKGNTFTQYGDYYKNAQNIGYKLFCPSNELGWYTTLEDSMYEGWDRILFEDENGHLFYTQADHDGTHYQELRELTKEGYDLLDHWYSEEGSKPLDLSEWEILDKVWNDPHYSRLPRLSAKIDDLYKVKAA